MKKVVFLSAIKALYKKEETDVADHLKTVDGEDIDDSLVETILKELDGEKVTTLKADAKTRFNDGVGKGTKDTSKKFEDKIRTIFDIEDNTLLGDDLLDHLEVEIAPTIGAGGDGAVDFKKITADDLDKIPAVKKLKQDHTKALALKDTEKETAVDTVKKEQSQQSLLGEIISDGLAYLDGKKPILPADATKANNQKNDLFTNKLKGYSFAKDATGKVIPVDADGNQLEDKNGVVIEVANLYETIADSGFEFAVADERESSKNKNKVNPSGNTKYTGGDPLTVQKYTELLLDENLEPEARQELMDAYGEKYSG